MNAKDLVDGKSIWVHVVPLGATRQEAIVSANVDPGLSQQMASLNHNELSR